MSDAPSSPHGDDLERSIDLSFMMPLLSEETSRLVEEQRLQTARQAAEVIRKLAGRLVEGQLPPAEISGALVRILTTLALPDLEGTRDPIARISVNLARALFYQQIPEAERAKVVEQLLPSITSETSVFEDKWQGDIKEHLAMSIAKGIVRGPIVCTAGLCILRNLDAHWQRSSSVSEQHPPQQLATDSLFASTWKEFADPVFTRELAVHAIEMLAIDSGVGITTKGLLAKGLGYALHLGTVPSDLCSSATAALVTVLPSLREHSTQYGFIASAVMKLHGKAYAESVTTRLVQSLETDERRGLYVALPEAFGNAIEIARFGL